MRPLIFTAGLIVAAKTACAEIGTPSAQHVTLTNGCVYAQNLLRQDNSWSLIYTRPGTSVQCALTIHGQTYAEPTAQPAPLDPVATAQVIEEPVATVSRAWSPFTYDAGRPRAMQPGYMTGVYR